MDVSSDATAIIDCLEDPAIILAPDYRILWANPAYQAIYGEGEKLRRRHCFEVSHGNDVPCDQAGEHCPVQECLATGHMARVLHVHHTPRGQEYVNVETWPVTDDAGDVKFFVEVLRPSDIAQTRSGDGLIGSSPAFRTMLGLVDRVAAAETNVLLLGESGTGKEVVARTLHDRSERKTGPFVPVECTGIPGTLFESELFGYVRGAFTGATTDKPGLVESAHGGTLFLDEVGDIPLEDQVKLLRLLETRQFRRVGSNEPRAADFRLVCATNKDLAKLVSDGLFREDLYYRLNVFEIVLPPLRRRTEDIESLSAAILERLGSKLRLSARALGVLQAYRFPGNIRELRNILERAILMCDGDELLPDHLPERVRPSAWESPASDETEPVRTLQGVEADYLRKTVSQHSGSRRELADQLGISERALYRKLSDLRRTESA